MSKNFTENPGQAKRIASNKDKSALNGAVMTNMIFCLIFIQVGVFLISGFLLLGSLAFGYRQRSRELVLRHDHCLTATREGALTRSEIEYFMADEPA